MVVYLVIFGERTLLRRLCRECGVLVQLLEPLVSRVSADQSTRLNVRRTLFAEAEVVCPAGVKRGRDDLVRSVYDALRLAGVPFLFTGIVLSLLVFSPFFCGRSIGLSATSMMAYRPSFF